MWPLLGALVCFLLLFGQRPDNIIKAWTETSNWNLSTKVSPQNIYYDEETKGCRWPAFKADGYAPGNYYTERSYPVAKECRMGALLALPATMDPDALELETQPARILAQAFQDYGAYLVDDTAWDVYAIITEWGPDGRFSEEFEKNWGFSPQQPMDTPWGRDMLKIFTNLHVVVNNAPDRIGGGGTPRAPLAPDFIKK